MRRGWLAVLEDAGNPLLDMVSLDGLEIGGVALLHQPEAELADGAEATEPNENPARAERES